MLLAIDASRANNEQKTGVEWYGYFVIQEMKKIVPPEIKVILYSREPLKGELAKLPANWEEKVLKWPLRRLWTQVRLSWEMWRVKHVTCPSSASRFGGRRMDNMKHVTKEKVTLFVPAHVLPLICPAKVVTTIHDLGGVRFPAGYSWFERWYARFSNRLAVQRAVILTPSEFVRQEIIKLFQADPSRVRVIPNAYDKEMFHLIENKEKVSAVLKKYGISPPYFLSISRLEEKKNTVGIVEAFEIFRKEIQKSKIQDTNNIQYPISNISNPISWNLEPVTCNLKLEAYKLVLLGKPGYGYERVEQAIKSSKYKDDIILPGWVATEDVPCLMAGASAFIFPSFYEGFGIPVLEAMACGTPVIAANRAALPEVAQEAAILVDPYKPAEIAQALTEIVSSPELRQELIKRGLERVKDFSWEKTARLAFDIIQRMT